mgnify:CR=1 FL=1
MIINLVELPLAILLKNEDGSDMSMMDLFHAGKEIMWPILLLSFVGITVVAERLLFIIRENGTREAEVVEKMLESVEKRDIEGALAIGKKSFEERALLEDALDDLALALETALDPVALLGALLRVEQAGVDLVQRVIRRPHLLRRIRAVECPVRDGSHIRPRHRDAAQHRHPHAHRVSCKQRARTAVAAVALADQPRGSRHQGSPRARLGPPGTNPRGGGRRLAVKACSRRADAPSWQRGVCD